MKRLLQTVIGCVSALSAMAQSSFTPGNLVVLQTTGTVSKAGSQATLKEFTTAGAAGMSVAIPTAGPTPFQTAGVYGGSEGFLTTSTDGKYLVLAGYATAAPFTDITGTAASSTPRAVGLVYPSGFYLQYDTSNTFFSANDIRGAISDGTNFWASGASNNSIDGIDYFGPGPRAALAVSAAPPKAYGMRIFNGQIYFSSQKAVAPYTASQLGIFSLGSGLPTSGTVTTTQVINTAAVIPQDFSFNAAGDICYIAVNLNTSAGGIQKWTRSGSTWTMAYQLGTGATNIGAYGLVVDYSGALPVVYATTFETAGNRVIKIVDNGIGATAATIVAATAGTFYKGISFAPVASGTPLVNISVNRDTASEAGMSVITVIANASAPVTSDQTVALAVSGTGITAGDYSLSGTTITILNGATSGSVTFTVADDILGEGTEIANLTISAPSSGLVLGRRTTQRITIADNDGNNHPVIVMDTTTTNFIDGGSLAAISTPFKLSGVVNDHTDAAKTLGINFKVSDLETVATSLTVSVASSNLSVVPLANITVAGTDSIRTVKITPAAVGYSNVTVTVSDGTDITSFIINYAASAASATPAATLWHTGMSDASDGTPIDDNYYISADDELNVLNVYSRSASGLPLQSYNYTSFLSLPNPGSPEVDVEAAAASPVNTGRVYFLGSMSNGKSPFDNKPNRDRIFATTHSGTGAATTFSFNGYAALRTSLLAWGDANGYSFSASAAVGVDSKSASGFAAEGMVFGPDNTTLYVGLRAPLVPTATRTKAVIAPVLNFETWFNNGAPSGAPAYGAPIELDLGGRGVRDITRLSNGSYVIVAGNPGGTPLTSAIYKWTGHSGDAPIIVSTAASSVLNLEGVMQVNTAGSLSLTSLQVITDNGDDVFYNDGTVAKDFSDLSYRKFRSDIITGIDLTYPEINITGNGTTIADGSTTPGIADSTYLGDAIYGNTMTRTFVVQNSGTAALSVSGISFTGTAAADFSLAGTTAFPLSIPAGGAYTVTVQFAPQAIGLRNATMNISSNDNDEATYDFAIRGNGLCNTPASYTVSGGGAICTGATGLSVDLGSSVVGVNYQLYKGATLIGSAVSGTGSGISFGAQTAAGVYTVLATDATTACTAAMTGSATLVVNPLPVMYAVTGGGSYCADGTGVSVGLSNSQSGVDYQLYHGSVIVGSAMSGTGAALDFGAMTAAGSYSVQATNVATTCVNNMSSTASVVINALPAVYAVSGGGSYCDGGTGVNIVLGGSSAGINYKLYNGSALVSTVSGTGAPFDFGAMTAAGLYTVSAENAVTSCVSNMLGSAVVAITATVTPSVTATSLSGTQVCTGTSVTFLSTVANAGAAPVYQWRVNGAAVAATSGYTYTPANGDIVSVKLTSNAACTTVDSAVASLTMTVNPFVTPSATIAAVPGNILCEGSGVTFTSSIVNGGTAPAYAWIKNGAVAGSGTTYAYTPADGDEIFLVLTSNKPCRTATTAYSNNVNMEIAHRYLPVVALSAAPGTIIAPGTEVTLTAVVSGDAGPMPVYKWVKNGAVISGATAATYVSSAYANNDSVSCIVTGSGICGMQSFNSVIMKINTTGVTEVAASGNLTIQPNPTTGSFYIKGNAANDEMILSVVNMLGQEVYQDIITSQNGVVNKQVTLSNNLPAGIYILSVHAATGTTTFRITLNH